MLTLWLLAPWFALSVAAGDGFTCALARGGSVKCWGNNATAELGDGTTRQRSSPVGVARLGGSAVQLAAGSHACAVLRSGALRCWGGDFWVGGKTTPRPVPGAGLVRSGAVGSDYQCVVTREGYARCGGGGEDGKIAQGSGVVAKLDRPVAVPGLGDEQVRQIAAGGFHACALTEAGGVKCWGSNTWSRIVDEDLKQVTEAREMPGLPPVESLVAGSTHTCALAAGRVYCWGDNLAGQLGDGTRQARGTPKPVPGLSNARAIAAGRLMSCAVDGDGGAWCWGSNTHGELGSEGPDSATPRPVAGVAHAQQISCGNQHCCAVVAAGQLRCWGANELGELGNGRPSADLEPAPQAVIQR